MDLSEQLLASVPGLRNLKEPDTIDELMRQLGIISEAMETCEKMMEYAALSMQGEGTDLYLIDYRQLASRTKQLYAKESELRIKKRSEK